MSTASSVAEAQEASDLKPPRPVFARSTSLVDVKERHQSLLGQALRNGRELVEGNDGKQFMWEVDQLLKDMNCLSESAESFEDYRWLSDAAIKWQVIFSSALNLPRTIQLVLPSQLLPPQPPITALSEEE